MNRCISLGHSDSNSSGLPVAGCAKLSDSICSAMRLAGKRLKSAYRPLPLHWAGATGGGY
jgi:hypothetical protein